MSARMKKNNETDLWLTCDSDQAALLGDSYFLCLCQTFQVSRTEKKKMFEIDVIVTNKIVLNEIVQSIGLPFHLDKIIVEKYPFFEMQASMSTSSLFVDLLFLLDVM